MKSKSKQAADEALDDYFADLFTVTSAPNDEPVVKKESQSASLKSNTTDNLSVSRPPSIPDDLNHSKKEQKQQQDIALQNKTELLEIEKREKLQKLLNQQTLKSEEIISAPVKAENLITEQKVIKAPEEISSVKESVLDAPDNGDFQEESIEVNNGLLDWDTNGRPKWAQEKFDVLLFEVSGLTLAVPLVALGQISTLDEKLTQIIGQSKWFMGILPTPHGDIKTINTALFVMPEKYKENFLENAKYVISIDGQTWGLAVDKVNQPVSLLPEDVKWRSDRTKRAWLAGTVKEKMCALIDIPRMAQLLNDSDKRANQ